MQNKLSLCFVLCVLVLFMSCGDPGSETAPTEPAADAAVIETGPDSTVVDADHYTAEFENDRVRIVRIAYEPGEESVMHYHPEAVAVYLTDAYVEMVLPNGETVEQQTHAGQYQLTPAGQHLPKNIGEAPLELILIELKSGASGPASPDGQDSIALDPDHYTAEFENANVRILRITYGSGEESVMHYHPDNVAVFLTEHLAEMTVPDGSILESRADAGDALFTPAGQHLPKNISDGPLELILVELK